MAWNIPDFFQQTWDKLSFRQDPTKEELPPAQTSGSIDQTVPQKGTVPFRRVESAVHTFVQVAVPADLDRLYRHRNNIKKWRKINDHPKLRAEYINSARTVKQLTRNLQEMELLRAKVLNEDLPEFDRRLNPAKEQAMEAICEFLEIHGEALNSEGKIGQSEKTVVKPDEVATDASMLSKDTQEVDENISADEPSTYADCTNDVSQHPSPPEAAQPPNSMTNTGVVQMRGNRLVIEPQPASCSEYDHEASQHESITDDKSAQNNIDPLTAASLVSEVFDNCQNEDLEVRSPQQQEVIDKPEDETEEWWEKLRKDLTELHTTICDFSSIVHQQGEAVDDIAANVEKAEENISEGKSQLKKATVLKAAMFPVLGAVVGGIVGGPIGFAAGLKLGSVTSGLAAAGVTGGMIGYQGGKMLKEKQDKGVEMKPLNQEEDEDSTES